MTTRLRKPRRVTIKIHRDTFDVLREMRKDTGVSISLLMTKAVLAYAEPRPGVKRTRVR